MHLYSVEDQLTYTKAWCEGCGSNAVRIDRFISLAVPRLLSGTKNS